MVLQELMAKFDGHSERLPEHQLRFGQEVDLKSLTEALNDWERVWDQLNPQTVDQRRYHEQRALNRALIQHTRTLKGMTFQLKALDNCSKEFICEHILRENPDRENLVKELFRPDSWWLLFAYSKARDGSGYLDFCHANTRKVVRLGISSSSPIVRNLGIIEPSTPRGEITAFGYIAHGDTPAE